MKTADFDYILPPELIAQTPVEPRDSSRLMVVDRQSGGFEHRHFYDLPEYLRPGDCLVVNDTRVLPARLRGTKEKTGGKVEILLLSELEEKKWEALVRPAARLKAGSRIVFTGGELIGEIEECLPDGRRIVFFACDRDFHQLLHQIGEMPLPPYIHRPLSEPERYQTVYAKEERSAAAPTAGLHFTSELLERIQKMGVKITPLTLVVGLDTFRPIKEADFKEHRIHSESYRVPEKTAEAINQTIEKGGRIIAVGTTSTRVLETVACPAKDNALQGRKWRVKPDKGRAELYIYPGNEFKIVDTLITNFHLPRSTLLLLVSAFAGTELIKKAYQEAIEKQYRFFSFGDAMLII